MNENTIVKEYEVIRPLFHKKDSIFDNCTRDCHYKYFHTFDHNCVDDIKFKNIRKNKVINLTISDKSMGLFEINEKLKIAGQNGFIINRKL